MNTERRMYTDERGRRVLLPIDEREWKQVLWEVSDSGVLSITLNRPEASPTR